jgi:hypothetical protein
VDQIIPKQFLKRIERTGFGEILFFDWRFLPDGSHNPDFELNLARHSDASILSSQDTSPGGGRSRRPLLNLAWLRVCALNQQFDKPRLPQAFPVSNPSFHA